MGRSIAGLWERIAAVAAAAALAGWGITALYRTADRRHTSYGGIHVAAAINWYNARQPAEAIRSLADAPALYETLGGREGLGLSYERFLESLTIVSLKEKGKNMVVAYAPPFVGRPPENRE